MKSYCSLAKNDFFEEIEENSSQTKFELSRYLPTTLNGNISIKNDKKSRKVLSLIRNEDHVNNDDDDKGVFLLGKHIVAIRRNNLTVCLLESLKVKKIVKTTRPGTYTKFLIELNEKLTVARIPRIENFDIGHLATSSYSHDDIDRKFRNMTHNTVLMHKSFNRGEFSLLEKFFLHSTKLSNVNDDLILMTREFLMIHDKTTMHPLGVPLFILVIISFIYKDGFKIKIFFLPNAPLKVNYEFFEITLRQLEDNFGKYLLNECILSLLKNRSFHENDQCSEFTISSDQIQYMLKLSRTQLEDDHLVTGSEIH